MVTGSLIGVEGSEVFVMVNTVLNSLQVMFLAWLSVHYRRPEPTDPA